MEIQQAAYRAVTTQAAVLSARLDRRANHEGLRGAKTLDDGASAGDVSRSKDGVIDAGAGRLLQMDGKTFLPQQLCGEGVVV